MAGLGYWSNGERSDGLRALSADLAHAAGQLDDGARSGRANPEIAVAVLDIAVGKLDRVILKGHWPDPVSSVQ